MTSWSATSHVARPLAGTKTSAGPIALAECGREVFVWDVWCAESSDGIWHLDGECGNTPAPHLVREHCDHCTHLRVNYWCAECVAAYRHEIDQQKRTRADEYLWCHHCNKFTLTWTADENSPT